VTEPEIIVSTTADSAVFEFENILPQLDFLPIAARRALDHAGLRLSLEAWRSLSLDDRCQLVAAGADDVIDRGVVAAIVRHSVPAAQRIEAVGDPDPLAPPDGLLRLLEPVPLDTRQWARLRALDRYALAHVHRRAIARGDSSLLQAAYEDIVMSQLRSLQPSPGGAAPRDQGPATSRRLAVPPPPRMPLADVEGDPSEQSAPPEEPLSSHLSEDGSARMVDVGEKPITNRRAVASAIVHMRRETFRRLSRHDTPKGDVLAVARIAGIQAAKRTSELIPLCHLIALTSVEVHLELDDASSAVQIVAIAQASDRTGVEMEALVAASVAGLTIYDMLKGIDREMTIDEVKLLEKSGGRSGHYERRDM
jgi:cyclic pyranopterin phosphate synthase